MEFFWGLILGAILGVVADRIWSRVESKPRFEIASSVFWNATSQEGYEFKVRNAGSSEIPPYRIQLFHPLRGWLDVLRADDEDIPLLPGQSRVHSVVLIDEGHPFGSLYRWMMHESGERIDDPKIDEFVLRILMHKSDRILLESPTIGRALARAVLRSYQHGSVGHLSREERMELSTPFPLSQRCMNWIRKRVGWRSPEEIEIEKLEASLK